MEKTNQNLLQKLTQILNVDKIISPDDVLAIRDALIGVLANNKKELESLTDETKQAVNSILDKVLNEHDTYLEKTKQIAQEAKSETTEAINSTLKSLEEVKALCKEVMECKPENGADADEEMIIQEVLAKIKLPEYKEVVLDDGTEIVAKINELPVNEENQIDAKHIKNLPEGKGGKVISGGVTRKIVEQMIEAAGGGGGTPGGSDTQVQFNDGGSFGGDAGLTYNKTTDSLTIGGGLTVDTNTLYVDATNNMVGVGTTSPTHSLTLPSTSTGIAIYNTADQTTNYERGEMVWSANEWLIRAFKGGTGTQRNIKLISHGILTISGSASSSGDFIFRGSTSGANAVNIVAGSTYTATSGVNTEVSIKPVINQSSTAGYTALLVNPTETTTGSGSKLLADFQVGGSSKFNVANTGITTITNTTDAASNQILNLKGARATPATDDSVYASFSMNNSVGTTKEYVRLMAVAADVTSTSEDGYFQFQTMLNGSLGNRARLTNTTFSPTSNDGIALGTTAQSFSDLFLASGGVINWNNGNATLTHSTGCLTSNVPIVAPKRVITTTDDSTAVIDVALTDVYQLTAIANNTTFSFTGTPTDGQNFIIRYKDAGVSKSLTWTGFTAIGVTLPTATTAGKWGYVGVTYNSDASAYHATAVATES